MPPPAPRLEFARWIVFEDEHLVAVNKPAGVLSQGGEGGAGVNLVDLARAHFARNEGIGVLHRLDRNVSGIVLLSKTPRAARALTMAIADGKVERIYRAVVRGEPSVDSFRVNASLRKNERTNEVEARSAESAQGIPEFKPAETDVTVLSRWRAPLGPCAALDVRPITGRSHQIRVHLAFARLPIVGDPKYGIAARGITRPLLHARAMRFAHPVTRKDTLIEAPIPWTDEQVRSLRPG
jgi:23S rRNA pseudouridine1911/1915/1917 synthase